MTNTEAMEHILAGMLAKRTRIDQDLSELRALLNPSSEPTRQAAAQDKPKRHTMSAAGRKAIAAAQRKRWARVRAEQGEPVMARMGGGKRKLSIAGRGAISRASKARWARERQQKAMAAGG